MKNIAFILVKFLTEKNEKVLVKKKKYSSSESPYQIHRNTYNRISIAAQSTVFISTCDATIVVETSYSWSSTGPIYSFPLQVSKQAK